MTWTFSDSLVTAKDKVRAMIGDTDTTDQVLSDEQIKFALKLENNRIAGGAYQACLMAAAKFAREVQTSADGFSASANQKAEAFHKLAEKFKVDDEEGTAYELDGSPFAAGAAEFTETDPNFTIGMHDNPRSVDNRSGDE